MKVLIGKFYTFYIRQFIRNFIYIDIRFGNFYSRAGFINILYTKSKPKETTSIAKKRKVILFASFLF